MRRSPRSAPRLRLPRYSAPPSRAGRSPSLSCRLSLVDLLTPPTFLSPPFLFVLFVDSSATTSSPARPRTSDASAPARRGPAGPGSRCTSRAPPSTASSRTSCARAATSLVGTEPVRKNTKGRKHNYLVVFQTIWSFGLKVKFPAFFPRFSTSSVLLWRCLCSGFLGELRDA